jgi:hypothetical protein
MSPVDSRQAPASKTVSPNDTGRVFLLSPASCRGRRAQILLRDQAAFDLATRVKVGGAPLGEVFAFLSGLYFRGKLAYATAFGRRGPGSSVLIITPSRGLLPPDTPADLALLREFAAVDVSVDEPRYREPLSKDVARLAAGLSLRDHVVLLGSVATGKYVDLLAGPLGDRLLFPGDFVGRGDMSRGGLMLRCVDDGRELEYVIATAAVRHGPRPPKLEPRTTR